MGNGRLRSLFHLIRQGWFLEREFGSHSLESLVSMAELIEESVYEPGSLEAGPSGFSFRLNNPPLRIGGFSSVRILVDGTPVPIDRSRVRSEAEGSWRSLSELSREHPLDLAAGIRTEFAADVPLSGTGKVSTVRLELRSVSIPPLVWFEFTESPRRVGAP